MHKLMLKELFAAQSHFQSKINQCNEQLADPKLQKKTELALNETKAAYEDAETHMDAMINFYLKYHGGK